jgi:hypothetical protein
VNVRHRRNFIQSVEQDGQVLIAKDNKARVFYDFYDELLGILLARSCRFMFDVLGLPQLNLVVLSD